MYENTNKDNPTAGERTITFIVNDGTADSDGSTRTINVISVNQRPVISSVETSALTYNEGVGKKQTTAGATVTDPDNANLHSASVAISGGYVKGQDELSFTDGTIKGSWNAETGTLSLSNDASLADYQTALRNVMYENTNKDNPTAGERTITFIVNDGAAESEGRSRTISLVAVNQQPVISSVETSALTYNEGSGKKQITAEAVVTDPDNANLHSASVTISAGYVKGQDELSFTDGTIKGSWNGETGTLSLSNDASLADYQAALRNVMYENTNKDNPTAGERTITFVVNDGAADSEGRTRTINVIAINQRPVISSVETSALTYNEGAGKKQITAEAVVTDPDNTNLHSASVAISGGYVKGQDELSFTDGTIKGSWDPESGILTLSNDASLSDYQAALRNVMYENTNSTNPNTGPRTITFVVNDGELASTPATRSILINHTNRAPVLSNIEENNIIFNVPSDPVNISSTISVSDLDDSNLTEASLQITNGYLSSEDVLSLTSTAKITSTWNKATGTLSLTGSATISEYQQAIRDVKYANSNGDNPSLTTREITFIVNDGKDKSNSPTRTITFNSTPSATNVLIDGEATICKTLTGSYTYSDIEGDAEGYSTFRWLRATTADGAKTAITDATSNTYTLTTADQDKYLFFEVTPQAKTGSVQGKSFTSSASAKITNKLPTATFSGSATICEGTTANISVTFTGTAPFELVYTDGSKNFDLKTSELINQIPVSKAGTYKGISLTDNLGCEVSNLNSTATITTKPSPTAKIVDLLNAYSLRGTPVPLKGTPTGGIFSGKGVIAANKTFSPSLAGVEGSPHAIVYSYVDPATGCFDNDTVMVTIIDADATISGLRPQNQYCTVDIPSLLTGVNVAGAIGTFSISGGVGLTDNKNNTAILDPTKLVPGNYTLSYTYIQTGTSQTIYKDITINRADNVIISGFNSNSYCSGASAIAISSNYQQGTFQGNGIENINGTYQFNPQGAELGLNTITFSFTNTLGCVITDTLDIEIKASARPSFDLASGCWNNAATAFVNTTSHPDSITSWKWTFGDPSAPASENTSTIKDPSHRYSNAGDYNVQLMTTNLNKCTDTFTKTIHLGTQALASIELDKECTNRNEALHIHNVTSSDEEIESYRWTVKDAAGKITSYNTKDITHNFSWNQNYTVKLSLKTIYGCKDSVSKNIYLGAPHSLKDSLYAEGFENKNTWNVETVSNNNWSWQLPTGTISTAHAGSKAISSQFREARNSNQMIISSPCFDFTGIEKPYIELWINSALAQNEEGAVLQYKTEDSQEWNAVGATGSGINWFNSDAIATGKTGWTGNTSGWKRSANALDVLANKKNVKFRIVYYSSASANAANMFAFDDVSIGKRERVSLFEYFNNLSTGSVSANTQQLNLVLASNPKDVVSIEYHTSFPGSDTLNTANTADPGSRVLYYGIGLVPYGLLNGGMNSNLVYDFSSRKPTSQDIIAQSLTAVPYLLSITTEKAGGNIMGKVLLTSQGNYTNQQITLNIAVVEDVVIQSDNGALTLYNVIKKFVPSAGGTLLKSDWTRGEQLEIPFSWEFVKVYDPTKVKIVAFVQSVSSKEVLQASASEVTFTTANPPVIEDKPEVKKAVIAPNPASDMARIIFPEALKKDVRMEMMSLNGKVVKVDRILQDVDIYELNLSEIPNGLYLIKLTGKNGETNILKLVIRK
jgi:hypothetical protein